MELLFQGSIMFQVLHFNVFIYIYIYIFFFFWLYCVTCWILVPQPGFESMPPAVDVWDLNHWTVMKIPSVFLY